MVRCFVVVGMMVENLLVRNDIVVTPPFWLVSLEFEYLHVLLSSVEKPAWHVFNIVHSCAYFAESLCIISIHYSHNAVQLTAMKYRMYLDVISVSWFGYTCTSSMPLLYLPPRLISISFIIPKTACMIWHCHNCHNTLLPYRDVEDPYYYYAYPFCCRHIMCA